MNIQFLKKDSKKGFKKLVGINRETVPAHIAKLKRSIDQIGMLQAIIVAELGFITGKKELYIIEGQHKYEACMALGIDIPYVVIKGIDNYKDLVKTIALLNSSSKSWALADYILAWGSVNNDYKALLITYNKYSIEPAIAAAIMSKNQIFSGNVNVLLKSGEFKISSDNYDIIIANASEVISKLPLIGRQPERLFISELVETMRELGDLYDHKSMLGYIIKQNSIIITNCVDTASVKLFFQQYKDFISKSSSHLEVA